MAPSRRNTAVSLDELLTSTPPPPRHPADPEGGTAAPRAPPDLRVDATPGRIVVSH